LRLRDCHGIPAPGSAFSATICLTALVFSSYDERDRGHLP
jgi:hypothetical protein